MTRVRAQLRILSACGHQGLVSDVIILFAQDSVKRRSEAKAFLFLPRIRSGLVFETRSESDQRPMNAR